MKQLTKNSKINKSAKHLFTRHFYDRVKRSFPFKKIVLPITLFLALVSNPLINYAQTWTQTGSVKIARINHTSTLLPSGKVLITGGDVGGFTKTCELYDPSTGTWSYTSSMSTARTTHTATLLSSGKVLIAGGFSTSGAINTCEIYDPSTETWSNTDTLHISRHGHTANILPSGKVLVVGGGDIYGGPVDKSEVYDPSTGKWSQPSQMSDAVFFHTAVLLPSGKVWVAFGTNCQLYDPSTDSWTLSGNITSRASHTANLLPSGKVLIVGGIGQYSYRKDAELYDPSTNTLSNAGNMSEERDNFKALLLANGKVLVMGGGKSNYGYQTCELYDPATNSWSLADTMNTTHDRFGATLLKNDAVLVSSGYSPQCELYNVPKSQTFSYSGNVDEFTVPAGVTKLKIKMWGAGGGGTSVDSIIQSVGGAGGYAYSEIDVTPCEKLLIYVGKGGANSSNIKGGASGGGATAIYRDNTALIIAGGGGGGSVSNDLIDNIRVIAPSNGGAGGGNTGENGTGTCGGYGGSQSSAGAAISCSRRSGVAGLNGDGGEGTGGGSGSGNNIDGWIETNRPFGKGMGGRGFIYNGDKGHGGGGGGYFGGASGGGDAGGFGGGGGSGYVPSGGTNLTGSGNTPPKTNDNDYQSGIAIGGTSSNSGGNGLLIINYEYCDGAGIPTGANIKTGDVTISTQTQMNAFFSHSNGNKYTKVAGNLTINGNSTSDPITSFCNLGSLTEVSGHLLIQQFTHSTNPTDLCHLAALEKVGRLTIITCPGFTCISLPSLTNVAGSLMIRNNRFAKTITAAKLSTVGGGQFMVSRNHRAEKIQFSSTASSFTLTNVLENATVDIQSNGDSATNALSMDFNKITSVAKNFTFANNQNTGVSNFDNIFSGLSSVGGNLVVTNNTYLNKCCIAYNTAVSGSTTISGNTGNCADLAAVAADCSMMSKRGKNVTKLTNADLFNQLTVYPNPSSGKFEIELTTTQAGNMNITVTDLLGRTVLTQSHLVNGTVAIPLLMDKMPNGQYIIQLELNGKLVTKRIHVLK